MESPPEGYRRNVGICLVNPNNKKTCLKVKSEVKYKMFKFSPTMVRRNLRLCLDLPSYLNKGGIDKEEVPRTAAFRELREETGVTSAEILAEVPCWLTYDFPPDAREKLGKLWGCDWKGQAQKWFLFRFTGKDEEINLLGDGTERPEFGEWAWMLPQEVIERAVYLKKPVYKEVLNFFKPHLEVDLANLAI